MKKVWKAIGLMLALVAIYYAAQLFVGFVIGIIKVIPIMAGVMSSGEYPDIMQITQELTDAVNAQTPLILFFAVAIAVPFYYLIYRNRKQELMTFVSFRGIGAVSIPVLVLFGISVNFLIEWLLSLASQLSFLSRLFEQYDQLAEMIVGGNFILSLLAVGIIGPIFEEILFRGLIFGEFRKVTKVRVAVFIQALLFGIYHLNVIQGSYAFIIGILLGYIYYRSNSIIAPMIVHITINASTVILSEFMTGDVSDNLFGLIVAVSAVVFLATGAFILMSRSFKRTMDDSLFHANQAPGFQPPLPPM